MTAMAAAAASRALLRRRGALIPGLTGWMAAAAPSRLPAARQERREIHVLPRGSLAPPGAPSWPDRDSPVARTMWPTARRTFRTEADFHAVADEALETIQDAIDEAFEEGGIGEGGGDGDGDGDGDGNLPEVGVASGVLTLSMPPHGTWVINKQTPNRQLWWSSPLSGPRRYEFSEGGKDGEGAEGAWTYTRYVDAKDARGGMDAGRDEEFANSKTLGRALCFEIKEVYGLELELDLE